ncbi:efflux RND transporter permease subunit [Winogradskyella poriferorum]|uniref:Efflux RND transporter permease subunit n=1 Tax=Winogradskyella poriferorum TaxID=307627 RepID=A0ABU7W4L5_9FLAO
MKIAEISIKRPSIVIVLFTVLILGGLFSYNQLGYELIPKFSINVVSITTTYPGASPSEVENTVTREIEDAVSSMENIKKLEAQSFESLSVVTVTLNNDADVNYALNDAQRKINAILKDLPEDIDPPSLNKFSLSDLPIISIGATSSMNNVEFFDVMDKKIQPILSRINGVAQVNLIGGQEREIKIDLNPNLLHAYSLSIPQVQQAIMANNLDFPTGNIETREKTMIVRLSGKFKTISELRNLVVASPEGSQIRLSDVADVQDSQKEVEKISRINQNNAILIQVIKQSDANAVAVSEAIKKEVVSLESDYANIDLKLNIVDDSTEFTLAAADSVIHDLLLAVVLVAFVMLFFLHSIRNSIIVMISIPASLIATFIGIYLLGYTLNLMSLLGLSLVVGILVDDAIVVLENIYRHMEMGKNKVRASYDASKEIGFTVTAITLVIVVVFLPIALSSGLVTDIIAEFCVTVIIATLFSLLSSFTIVPWLSSRYGKLEHITEKNMFGKIILGFEKGLDKFTDYVTLILKWSLKHKVRTLAVVLLMFIASIALIPTGYIGTAFFPKTDRGQFLVQLELPKDATIEKTNFVTQKVEAFLSQQNEVKSIVTTVGQSSDGVGTSQATSYKSEITVTLIDKSKRSDNSYVYAAKIKRKIQELTTGVKIKTVPVGLMGSAENAPLALVVTGNTLDSAMVFANKAADKLKNIPGATGIKLSVETGNPEVLVEVDRDKMAALGLSLQNVGSSMQIALSGNNDTKYRDGSYEYDINIAYADNGKSNIDDVRDITFLNDNGEKIKLYQFANVNESSGPSVLERRDKSASVTVQGQTVGRPTGTIAAEWEQQFSKIEKPQSVNYVWGGDMENQSEGFGSLGVALIAAILLVYLVMVALYDSFIDPFIVLFSIPLSFIGALLILALTNNALNVFTILGIIMLIGLVSKNAILLVDFAKHRETEGIDTYNALIQANHARLRPILMTTIAMVIGMVPIALASGAAAELNNGLAWVIIGGLLSSLFLTLIVVPIVYAIFRSLEKKWSNKKGTNKTIDELMLEDF